MRDEHADQHRHRARDRIAGALEQRLARRECAGKVATSPRVGELVAGDLGAARREQLDLFGADWLPTRPGRDLVDLARKLLGIVAHDLDQQARGFGVDADAAVPELLRHPIAHPPLRHVVHEHVAGLGARFRERGILLQLRRDEREHGVGSGARKVRRDRLRVRGLPAIDVLDDHEPAGAAEQAERVAGGNSVVTARLVRRQQLRCVLADAVAQPPQRAQDLRTVAAGDQIDRLELARRHRGTTSGADLAAPQRGRAGFARPAASISV